MHDAILALNAPRAANSAPSRIISELMAIRAIRRTFDFGLSIGRGQLLALQVLTKTGHVWRSPVPSHHTMTAARQYVGILASLVILAPAVVRGQVGSTVNSPSPPAAISDGSVITNTPVTAPVRVPQPAMAVQPAQPTVAVPRPAEVVIPSATAPPPASSAAVGPTRPMPLKIPTTQELLTKSIASAPGGSQQRLTTIAASPLSLSPTNDVTPAIGAASLSSFSTNPPGSQSSPWQKTNPLLNGVDYHW
jgi:hypothetical protein